MSVFASNRKIVIDLSDLDDYTDITDIMHGVDRYTYEFSFNGETIKYGVSADNARKYGDRLYRQAGHLPGWKRPLLEGPSGAEMDYINRDYINQRGRSLNRHGMIITVTDMTGQTKAECEELERYLIDNYINNHGKAPIGNKDVRTRFAIRKHHNTKHFRNLFNELA